MLIVAVFMVTKIRLILYIFLSLLIEQNVKQAKNGIKVFFD